MFKIVFEKYAPLKNKYLRANLSKFFTKEFSKALMLGTKLRKKFLKDRTEEFSSKYKKQRNNCVHLFKIPKKDNYENTDMNNLTDSNKFWKMVKPNFSSKPKSKNSIALVEGTKFIQEEGELSKTFNDFFISIVKNLGIDENLFPTSSSERRNVESIISKFQNYPSIVIICNRFDKNILL